MLPRVNTHCLTPNRTCASERTGAAADAVSPEKFSDRYADMGFLISRLGMACLQGIDSIVLDVMPAASVRIRYFVCTGRWHPASLRSFRRDGNLGPSCGSTIKTLVYSQGVPSIFQGSKVELSIFVKLSPQSVHPSERI